MNDSAITVGDNSDFKSETAYTETRTKTDAISDAGLSMKKSIDAGNF